MILQKRKKNLDPNAFETSIMEIDLLINTVLIKIIFPLTFLYDNPYIQIQLLDDIPVGMP